MRTTTFFVIALLVCFTGAAQETGYQPGAIITLENERIEGLIKNFNLIPARILDDEIKFKKAEGEKVTVYSTEELLAYEFGGSLFVPKKTSYGSDIFVKQVSTRRLSLYEKMVFDGTPSYRVVYWPYIQLGTDPVIHSVRDSGFKKQMLKYLKDAPNLCQLIADGAFDRKDISEVVFLYNQKIANRK